ncbi:cysteine sulfinic acid decarboxylase-like isoform X2 [Ptychodera flava]
MENLTEDQKFLRDAMDIIFKEGVVKARDRRRKVVEYRDPGELNEIFEFSISEESTDSENLLEILKEIFKYSVLPANPRYHNMLYSGQDSYGLVGQWLTDCINPPAYTFECAPVFTVMEQAVFKTLLQYVGYKTGDGIFCPGGSVVNMYAMNIARFKKYGAAVKSDGLFGLPRLILFTSEQSHYSIQKGAALLGMGTNSVILVKCDERGKMIPGDLEEKIIATKEKGNVPLFVNATCGTTVLGAFDPVEEIADICEKHGIWLHVDAAWGGGALLSRKWKERLFKGVERSNSLAWSQHKMMGGPTQCTAFLMRDNVRLMYAANCSEAKYLFMQDKFYDVSYDTGDKTFQCGRKMDAFKLWLMLKAKGISGREEETNIKFENSRYFVQLIKGRPGYKLVAEPEFTNVCFWYIPTSLRNMEHNEDFSLLLGKVAQIIKERMAKQGTLMVSYTPLGNLPNFFRYVFSNPKTTKQDVEFIVSETERVGEHITVDELRAYETVNDS